MRLFVANCTANCQLPRQVHSPPRHMARPQTTAMNSGKSMQQCQQATLRGQRHLQRNGHRLGLGVALVRHPFAVTQLSFNATCVNGVGTCCGVVMHHTLHHACCRSLLRSGESVHTTLAATTQRAPEWSLFSLCSACTQMPTYFVQWT